MENLNQNKELFSALSKAQSEFKTPEKDKKAHYGEYASIGSINKAIRDPMTKNGLSVIQPIISIDNISYVKTIITHSSGQCLESTIPIPQITKPQKNFFHELGASISYLRRYSLQSMLNVSADDIEDDADSLNGVEVQNKQPTNHKTQNKDKVTSINTQDPGGVISKSQSMILQNSFEKLDATQKGIAFKKMRDTGASSFSTIKLCDFDEFYQSVLNLARQEG